LIRSSDAAQRTWTGGGRYRLVDVDVQNMGGTGTKTVFSGTNSGNNISSWIFNANCPAVLSITPSSATVQAGGTQTFTAGGGFAPYVFSILSNNSGGSINTSTGVYTAGTTAAVTDTIRVTDVFGTTSDATVNISGTPTNLVFTVQPESATAGQILTPALQVAVQDQFGNTVTSSNAAITLSIINNTRGAILSGTLTKNAVNGIATFDNLSIDAAFGYNLLATSGGLTGTSNLILIFAGQPDHLMFFRQPSNTFQSRTILPAVTVGVVDSFGNEVLNPGGSVTIAIGNNPGGATLLGTATRPVLNGGAVFLVGIDQPGIGYTLTASGGSLPTVVSNSFDITNPFLVTNTNDSGAGSLRQAIINANNFVGLGNRTVVFNIPGTPPYQIIRSFSNYPALSFGVGIDGTTQPGFAGSPVVFLSGPSVGLVLNGGNTVRGLNIFSATTAILESGSQNRIQGNFLSGTFEAINARGFRPLIGGTTVADRNVITNSGAGIILAGANQAIVTGNYIGTDPTGLIAQPNRVGIAILGSDGSRSVTTSQIGGDSPEEENLIAFNRKGITLFKQIGTPSANIKRNSIHSSTVLGIDFGTSGVTPNDPQDADIGENQLQNFPVLESAVSSSGNTTISGSFNSVPLQNYALNFYSSAVCSPSGFGDGEVFIGSANVSTDSGGITGFTANLPVSVLPGRVITATATDASGNTSEFSKCQTVAAQTFSIAGRIIDNFGNALSGAVINLQGSNLTAVTDTNGNYSFANLPAGANYTLVPVKINYVFSPATLTFNNLSANQVNQNIVGTAARFRLSGQVKSVFGAATFPLGGVTVSLSGAASGAVTTDENGNYAFDNLLVGNYTVTPSKTNFSFNPSAQTISLSANRTVDFSGGLNPPLEGRVFQCTNYISSMNADGSAKTQIITFPTGEGCSGATVSRDGRKLVYYTNTNKIFTANTDGSARVLISQDASSSSVQFHGIAISNNRQKIALTKRAFTVNRNDAFLRVMNADGSNLTTIYAPPTGEFLTDLNWSPDGNKIVFIKRPNISSSSGDIFVINADGSNLRRLTSTVSDRFPKFSPDGTKIAFIRSGRIFTINADGTGQTQISTAVNYSRFDWSPDGARIMFVQGFSALGVMNADGTNPIVYSNSGSYSLLSWGADPSEQTPVGAGVNVVTGGTEITFNSVSSGGTTTVTPISPASAGTAPNGFSLGQFGAFEINTTATYTPPVTICLTLPSTITQIQFNQLNILHNENGLLVNRTSSRNFATRQICAIVDSFSPFALAEQIDPGLPVISGLIQDENGNPLVGVSLKLTGAQERATTSDSDGRFSFVNLTEDANYNVQPKQVGYLFDEYSRDFVNLSGEQTAFFVGAAADFQIGGRISDGGGSGISGVSVQLDGDAQALVTTDADGNYVFTELPADGFYTLTPFNGVNNFSPPNATVAALTSDAAGINFQTFAPTAANVSIGGRVITPDGRGLKNARVVLTDSNGRIQTVSSSTFGYYRFEGIEVGRTYVLNVESKKYRFQPQVLTVNVELTDLNLMVED
ncbi:MAG TPA: carboxypeptidase regulatory-like domain-containing protein, partial [Pyrinomonadaceae bacterium]|nr:carboxypeptidase regulatory-like domain-containing protein [Pyrinomonadaceae bacterium]